jgi:hypothetical protein
MINAEGVGSILRTLSEFVFFSCDFDPQGVALRTPSVFSARPKTPHGFANLA